VGRRAVILITGLGLGGAQVQLGHITRAMVQEGWQVWVASLIPTEAYGLALLDPRVRVTSLGMRRGRIGVGGLVRLLRLIASSKPHILVGVMLHSVLLARAARLVVPHVPLVAAFRISAYLRRWAPVALRLTRRLDSWQVVNSASAAAELTKAGIVDPNRLTVIPNGVALSTAVGADGGVTDRSRSNHSLQMLSIGRLEPQKDYPTLLRALRLVRDRGAAVRCSIVGDGSLEAELRSLARELDLIGVVEFVGRRNDVPDLLRSCDVLVLSSRYEGMPNVVLEAMAAGRPVIATDVPGVRELLDDGRVGLIVPVGNPPALAEAILRLQAMREPNRQALGRAGHERAGQHFSIEATGRAWLDLLDSICGSPETSTREGAAR
jgi:glycosyltransferase involved in cell wall biosynthesis